MTVQEYFEGLKGKRVAVIGLGISNRPLVRMLLDRGIAVECRDKTPREKLLPEVLELERIGARLTLGEDYLENIQADVVFRTPGLNAFCPQLMELRQRGVQVTSEMEAFFTLCPCRIFGVTGSDGKTTTTTLIAKLLEGAGKKVWCGGNIGAPLLPRVEEMTPEDVAVVELSSFQLMGMEQSPQVAVVTNLSPNHLDIHKDMAEYVTAKENIYLHQGPEDRVVLNLDNEITNSFVPKAKGHVLQFSRHTRPEQGYYLREDQMICRWDGKKEQEIMDARAILIPGVHNIENYLAAFCAVDGLVSREVMQNLARTFGGVAHRIQLVREKDGVKWYNDSIATTPTRTIAGLDSFSQKLILIAGGYDKKIPFDVLGEAVQDHVKTLILTGHTADKIRQAVLSSQGYQKGQPTIVMEEDFSQAVLTASRMAEDGDVVLLSPACASFDHFKNFAQRGQTFKAIVNGL